ncbi:MAG: phage antirepressor KilAC domain-containing protein [Rhodoglobus sp.]
MQELSVADQYRARLDDLKVVTLTDGEVWSARDLMELAGYAAWQDFSKAINRAIASVNSSGLSAEDHFRGVPKMVVLGSGARRQVEDVELTRYGCYILFQNADARKPEIAAAQQYFAVQTRMQELAPATDFDPTSIDGITLILAAAQNALAKVKELEPKADAWDAIASAEGDYSVGDAAKILARAGIPTGPTRLFAQLGELKWTFRGSDKAWRAYAERVEKGYLTEKPSFHYHPGSGERVVDPPQVRVTAKGLERLRLRLHVGSLKAVSA